MDDLDRMFRRLLQNIRDGYPNYLTKPFEISELYQNLIPYRHNRRELQIETNEDYELALLRLLAGERGYLRADETVQRAMQQELRSPNPNPSSFRAYAASLISLAPDAVKRADQPSMAATAAAPPAPVAPATPMAPPAPARPPAPAAPPAPELGFADGALANGSPFEADAPPSIAARSMAPTQATATQSFRPQGGQAPQPPRPAQPPMPPSQPPRPSVPLAAAAPAPAHRPPATVAGGGSCRYCGGALPDGRRITFCPHCGQNLTIQHCPACGTELEVGWKFCVTCGRGVAAGG